MIPISLGNIRINLLSYSYFLFNMSIPSCHRFSCYCVATVQVNDLRGISIWDPTPMSMNNIVYIGSNSNNSPVWWLVTWFFWLPAYMGLQSLFWVSWEENKRDFFTTNKVAIFLIALESPLCFHMIPVSLGNTRLNLLSFSDCQPVWAFNNFSWDSDKVNNRCSSSQPIKCPFFWRP